MTLRSRLYRDGQNAGLRIGAKTAALVLGEQLETDAWTDWQLRSLRALQATICANDENLLPERAFDRTLHVIDGFSEVHQQRLRLLVAVVEASTIPSFRKRFSGLPPEEQIAALQSWSESNIVTRRAAFHGLKSVCMIGFWSCDETWPSIQYDRSL